jgi:hypothetical protein
LFYIVPFWSFWVTHESEPSFQVLVYFSFEYFRGVFLVPGKRYVKVRPEVMFVSCIASLSLIVGFAEAMFDLGSVSGVGVVSRFILVALVFAIGVCVVIIVLVTVSDMSVVATVVLAGVSVEMVVFLTAVYMANSMAYGSTGVQSFVLGVVLSVVAVVLLAVVGVLTAVLVVVIVGAVEGFVVVLVVAVAVIFVCRWVMYIVIVVVVIL